LQRLLERHPGNHFISSEACRSQLQETIESTRRALHADYVALSGYGYRADNLPDLGHSGAVYHSPGGLMLKTFDEAVIPEGGQASLVTVSTDQSIRLTSRRISPVRLIPLVLKLSQYVGEHELLEQMQEQLDRLEPVSAEQRYVVQWCLKGEAPILFELEDHDYRRGLERKLKGSRPVFHLWQIEVDRNRLREKHPADSLAGQYLEQLRQFEEIDQPELVADFLTRTNEHPQLQHRLRQLGMEITRESILSTAVQQGASFILDLGEESR
ncbi:MAG: hypothetical protein KDA65_10740, partial [Planctomycetaceae bacterium]|nr:hypothetical protein [Planctomycetaceae bacterium]